MKALSLPTPAATAPAIPTKRRLDYVDALRGFACAWVLLHHTFSAAAVLPGAWRYPGQLLGVFSDIGWLGVNVFLVLSGFCLFYPLAARFDLNAIQFNVLTFAKRRAGRILPPYYIALILLSVIETVTFRCKAGYWDWGVGIWHIKDLVVHLLMIHNLSHHTVSSVSGAFWSLALEAQLYLIFPLLIGSIVRFGLKSILAITLTISLAWQLFCFHKFGLPPLWTPTVSVHYDALPGRCFEFAAGMVAAALVARPRPGQSRVALGLILALLLPALYFVLKVSWFGPLIDQVWGIIFASTLVLLCETSNVQLERNRVTRWFVWFGAISYSVYLIHYPLVKIISPAMMHLPSNSSGQVIAGFIRLPLLIGLGYLFHLAFEKPFMPGRPRTERQVEVAAAISPAP